MMRWRVESKGAEYVSRIHLLTKNGNQVDPNIVPRQRCQRETVAGYRREVLKRPLYFGLDSFAEAKK
jgi:hypothetical protein